MKEHRLEHGVNEVVYFNSKIMRNVSNILLDIGKMNCRENVESKKRVSIHIKAEENSDLKTPSLR